MDICRVLTEFDPISPSEFSVSLEALNSGRLPDPALFFTWYCEKAREMEKYSGSVELSLKILDLALQRLPNQARIAKRFIMATRQSLLRYSAHLNALAAKLDEKELSSEDKAAILQTLKTIDLKTFEAGKRNSAAITDSTPSSPILIDNTSPPQQSEFNSSAWVTELQILDFILQDRINDALNFAQQGIFFPSVLAEKASANPVVWLQNYCHTLVSEIQDHLSALDNRDSRMIFGPEVCGDKWSAVVQDFLDSDTAPFAEEQQLGLILGKAKMAIGILSARNRANIVINDDSYF